MSQTHTPVPSHPPQHMPTHACTLTHTLAPCPRPRGAERGARHRAELARRSLPPQPRPPGRRKEAARPPTAPAAGSPDALSGRSRRAALPWGALPAAERPRTRVSRRGPGRAGPRPWWARRAARRPHAPVGQQAPLPESPQRPAPRVAPWPHPLQPSSYSVWRSARRCQILTPPMTDECGIFLISHCFPVACFRMNGPRGRTY